MESQKEMTITQLYDLLKESQEKQTEKLLEELQTNQKHIHKKIEINEKAIEELRYKHLHLERKYRKNNIVIFGLKATGENLFEYTIEQLNNLLEISLSLRDVNNIYTIGKAGGNQGILVQFISYLSKQEVFKNVTKLKNKNISIAHDLCPEDQKTNKILVKHLKQARAKNQAAKIIGNKIEIRNKIYTVEELDPLSSRSESSADEEEGDNSEEREGKAANDHKPEQEIQTNINRRNKKPSKQIIPNREITTRSKPASKYP